LLHYVVKCKCSQIVVYRPVIDGFGRRVKAAMLLTQQHLTVVATVNFHARINDYEVSASQLWHADRNHQWLEGIQRFANINILQHSV